MNFLIQKHRVEEYITIVVLVAIIILAATLSVFADRDTGDVFILLVVAALIFAFLFFFGRIDPINVLYTLCFGVSFLPYINLQMFPLSGVYVVAFLFVLFSLMSAIRSKKRIHISPQAKWMTALLGIGILSIIIAPDKKAVIIYGGQFFLYICVYITITNILDTKFKIVRAIKYVIYGSIVTIIMSGIQFVLSLFSIEYVVHVFYKSILGKLFVGTRGLERIGDSAALILNRGTGVAESSNLVLFRVFGTFEGPTIFGWYLLVISLLAGGMYVVQFKKKRVGIHSHIIAAIFLLAVCCMIFTWTRSALLAFLCAFNFMLIYRNKKSVQVFTPKRIRIFFTGVAVLLLLTGLLWLFQVPFPADAISGFNFQSLGGSTIARLLTIFFSLSYISQHPLIGIGMGNFKYVLPGVDVSLGEASFATAHNTFLELGVELGLVGLIIFVFILVSFMKQAAILVKASVGNFYHTLGIIFVSFWVGFLVVSMFGGRLIHPRFMTLIWIIAGIQTASYYLYLDDKKKEHTIYRLKVTHPHANG